MLFNIANSLEHVISKILFNTVLINLEQVVHFGSFFGCVVYAQFSLCTNPAKLYNSVISDFLDDEIVVKGTAVVLQVMEA